MNFTVNVEYLNVFFFLFFLCTERSTSPRAFPQQSVWSAMELKVQATTRSAGCPPAPTTLLLPHMHPGTPPTHYQITVGVKVSVNGWELGWACNLWPLVVMVWILRSTAACSDSGSLKSLNLDSMLGSSPDTRSRRGAWSEQRAWTQTASQVDCPARWEPVSAAVQRAWRGERPTGAVPTLLGRGCSMEILMIL